MPKPFTRVRLTLALLTLVSLLTILPRPALAQSISGCLPDVGTRVPVLFVHGFISGPNVWGKPSDSTSMYSLVQKIPGVYVENSSDPAIPSSLFNYQKDDTRWVDYSTIGPKLAHDIACMAESSREQHGPGKVIIVAHSMGGLAIRYAADPKEVFDGIPVADDIGLVVEIGTPNTGTSIADFTSGILRSVCTFGSVFSGVGQEIRRDPITCDQTLPAMWAMESNVKDKVNQLSKLPKSIPVMAIAGNATILESLGLIILPVQQNDDTVVPVDSATAEANNPAAGGGVFVTKCLANVLLAFFRFGTCEHTHLPSSPVVKAQVVKSIVAYLNYLHPSCPTSSTAVCLGTRFADVDGDKLPDRVGVTYDPTTPCNVSIIFNKTCSVTIYVVQGNGGYIVFPSQLGPYCFETCGFKVGFLGLTPMNGPVNDIVLSPSCSMFACPFVAYQVRSGQVQQIQFLGGTGGPSSNRGDVGFVCSVFNGSYRIELFTSHAAGQVNTDYDEVYQTDASGNMDLVSSKIVNGSSVPSSEVGPHCVGLKVPS